MWSAMGVWVEWWGCLVERGALKNVKMWRGRILTTHHGKRIAVIQNEFGEDLGLGSTVAAEGGGGEVFEESYEMNNG